MIKIARNLNRTRNAQIAIPAPVPAGTTSGSVVPLGTAGLMGWALTDRVTQAQIDNLNIDTPQGLADGQASVELIGVSISVRLTLATAVAAFARVYRVRSDGTYTGAADTGGTTPIPNDPIGFALEAITAGAAGVVGLSR